jgi:uncharacterized protein (AIM24 family)
MNKYKITPSGSDKSLIVEATSILEVTDKMRELGIAGKVVQYKDRTVTVTVTCGWGSSAHKWSTTREEAIAYRNKCEAHRPV